MQELQLTSCVDWPNAGCSLMLPIGRKVSKHVE